MRELGQGDYMHRHAIDVGLPEDFSGLALPVEEISVEQTWAWLRLGWRDFAAAPAVSLTFGVSVALVSMMIFVSLWWAQSLPFALPAAAGFFFMAPVIAVAFYDISRRLEMGIPIDFLSVASAWRSNPGGIFTMGLVMMLFHLVWQRIAMLLYPLFFGSQPGSLWDFVQAILFTTAGIPFLAIGTLVGGCLAVVAFAITVVSFPLLLDRDVGVPRAIATSIAATIVNWRVLLGWAGLIVVFTVAGIVTGGIGLAITLPLIGHSSWHAYRDLVTRPGGAEMQGRQA
jgi:uncharacterized membrane protein